MKKLLIFGLIIFCYTTSTAQNWVKGRVIEKAQSDSIVPVPSAIVRWMHSTVVVATDMNGNFRIARVDSSQTLIIGGIGFENDTVAYTGQQNLLVQLNKNVTLKEVMIRDKQSGIYVDPLAVQKLEVSTEKELRKAACCNLSESFETSTSVDVSYADAVTGVKQIQMLGLEGKYTLMTVENQPRMRGLATNHGLSYIPGSWIESIQLSKGTGTVVNGYESIGGQINVELKKPHLSERLLFNQYINQMGRAETNLNLAQKISKNWSTNLLLHADLFDGKVDQNKDGFLDIPVNNQLGLVNGWKYSNDAGVESEFGIKLLNENRYGGQNNFNPSTEKGGTKNYGASIQTERYEWFGKLGYLWLKQPYKSIGLTTSAINHNQNSWFGIRPYRGKENSFYANLIFQSILGNTQHKFKTGASFLLDDYHETFDSLNFKRKEIVPGAFFEYTWNPLSRFTMVAGLRYDQHNLFGGFFTPRLHLKYSFTDKFILRMSAGRGQRSANIFSENTSVFISSRQYSILGNGGKAYGLNPEIAWNYGLNLTRDFKLFYRRGSISFDVYRTDFVNQVVVDRDFASNQVLFYNTTNGAYVNSFQLEVNYELVKRLAFKTAWRLLDMETSYLDGKRQQPFVSKNRFFANLEYTTPKKWSVDYTLQWYGSKRVPYAFDSASVYQMPTRSPAYFVMNMQVSKQWKKFDAYIGCENLTDFRQTNLIMASDNPFGKTFDASLVWGPVIGRMVYAGMRFKIK